MTMIPYPKWRVPGILDVKDSVRVRIDSKPMAHVLHPSAVRYPILRVCLRTRGDVERIEKKSIPTWRKP
jgi:hypothetical protein